YILNVLFNAKDAYALSAFSNTDGTPGSWRPVYAIPEDWHSADDSRFQKMNLDIINQNNTGDAKGSDQSFSLNWNADGNNIPLQAGTKLESVEMKYMVINLKRPWFDATVFSIGEWFL